LTQKDLQAPINAVVQALVERMGITLLYLSSCSPNLNLIEHLWKFNKRRAFFGRYHPTFTRFRTAIEKHSRWPFDNPRQAIENDDGAQFPAIRGCLSYGRVKYNLPLPASAPPGLM
jgi:hypothetical protein